MLKYINYINQVNIFKDILSGENAFYNSPTYAEDLKNDLLKAEALPVSYSYNTERKIYRIAKIILSIIIFPIGIYKLIHSLAGFGIVGAARDTLFWKILSTLKICKPIHSNDFTPWLIDRKFKRITIEVDGYKIDAMIVGKKETLNNGKWLLASGGTDEIYESGLSHDFGESQVPAWQDLSELGNYNALLFNYPGVMSSTGMPSRQALIKAYRAMLTFLEDRKKELVLRILLVMVILWEESYKEML